MNYKLSRVYFVSSDFIKWYIPSCGLKFFSTMPKTLEDLAELKKKNLMSRERSTKYDTGFVYFQVISSGAKGTGNSLFMFADHKKYMFNCGEATQRTANEHKIKISKLEHVFITYPRWDNIGGLPGLSLTLKDSGSPELSVHGPYGIERIFRIVKEFVCLNNFVLKPPNCGRDIIFQDNVMRVFYVPLMNDNVSADSTQLLSSDDVINVENYNGENNSFESVFTENNNLNKVRSVLSMAYICKLASKPGSLNLEKCVELGVPPGPLLGKLKAGQDVTLPNGNLVKSADVVHPEVPGAVIIVLECPTYEFLNSLLAEESFKKHQSGTANESDIAAMVVHFTPSEIMESEKYIEWMNRFPKSTLHLNINQKNRCLGSSSVHEIQYKLNLLDQKIFPLLADDSLPLVESSTPIPNYMEEKQFDEKIDDKLFASDHIGYSCRTMFFKPRMKLTRTVPMLQRCPKESIQELLEMNQVKEELSNLKSKLASLDSNNNEKTEYPHVIFFGTGSSIPSKTRNVSGILLTISSTSHMLLDCGEGTYTQMARFYGAEKVDDILVNLNAIYISHLHADHHMGLVGVLRARNAAFIKKSLPFRKFLLFAPPTILTFLQKFNYFFETIVTDYILIPNDQLDYNIINYSFLEEMKEFAPLQIKTIMTTPVLHCPFSYGVSLIHEDGWKITYSGDTLPCPSLVKLGMRSDLLIHEATLEDSLLADAILKQHCTVSQAVEIGQKMKAKFTLLTHFSQRYAYVPRLNLNFANNVGIAFDNMKVRFCDLPKLPLMYAVFKVMFCEQQELYEFRAFKRQRRLQRSPSRSSESSV